jgi:hypothetical protein
VRLVLHIGTYKTGTTAVQEFLRANSGLLAQCGVHYAAAGSGLNANVVANAVALGDVDGARAFFDRHLATASRADAHTVLVSAENFYAMNIVAAVFTKTPSAGTLDYQRQLVERLKALLPATLSETQVVCYFRRPDRFADSLYNQRIKYENYDEPFDQYLRLIEPSLQYDKNAAIWSDVFGSAHCTYKIYESSPGDVRVDFIRDVLHLDADSFDDQIARVNEHMSRDVLEFKLERNRRIPDAETDLEYKIVCQLDQEMDLASGEPRHYQQFFSPPQRTQFLRRLAPELQALQATYGLPAFPAYDEAQESRGWTPYPGLSPERRAAIQRKHTNICRRPEFRLERMALRLPGRLRRGPARKVLLGVSRRLARRRAATHAELR